MSPAIAPKASIKQMIEAAKNLVKVFLIGPLMSYGVDLTRPISNGIVNPAKEFAFAVT
jgi:hypothetical protein